MKYIPQNLLQDENIVFQGNIHPFYATIHFTIAFLGIPLLIYYFFNPVKIESFFGMIHPLYMLSMFIGIPFVCYSSIRFLQLISTEIFLTDKRLLYKTGFISRNIFELPLDKVESVKLNQSILQRIIGAGTLIVSGIGGHNKPITYLQSPINLRNELYKFIKR